MPVDNEFRRFAVRVDRDLGFLPSQPAQDQLATASVSRHMDSEPVSPAWVYGSTPMPGYGPAPDQPVPLYLGAKLSANVDHAAAGGDDGRVLTGIFEAFVTDGTDARLSQIIPARPHKVADHIGEFFTSCQL